MPACGAGAIGALIVRFVPPASGSGVQQVEAVDLGLDDPPPLRVVPAKFVGGLAALGTRFFIGPLSYAAGTPGGLFAPLLAVGALWGVPFAALVNVVIPAGCRDWTVALVIVGMSAFFAAVVRAPVTGVALVMELTAVTTVTVPMPASTVAAVVVANAAGSPPIYESLRERMLAARAA